MIGWIVRLYKQFQAAGEEIKRLKEEERRALDDVHQAVQSGKLSGQQLNDVSLCCESITIQLKKRGGSK